MDWYTFFKFLHVSSAIIWVGGALIMVVLGAKADRAKNGPEIIDIVQHVSWAADRIYVPSSIATLVFGLTVAWLGALWSNLWVMLGLLGIATTIGLGIVVLTPRAKKIEADFRSSGASEGVVAQCRELLTIAKFDAVVLFTVVADMVLKPEPHDWALLLIMALVVLAAGALWLRPAMRRPALTA